MLGIANQRVEGFLILESCSSPITIKKPESKDTVFFRLYKSKSVPLVCLKPEGRGGPILEPNCLSPLSP